MDALFVILSTLPVMFRRRWPIVTLGVVFIAQALAEMLDIVGSTWLAVLVATYSVGAHTDGRRRQVGVAVLAVVFVVLLIAGVIDDEVTLVDAIATTGILTAALVLGDNVRRRRLHLETLADRAERAERERDLLARERVAEERNRIARELHDIVAHSVSVMVIQAAAARRNVTSRPEDAVGLLENVERTGRQTMDELRQVLGVLRDPEAERPAVPVPTLADLESLVDARRRASRPPDRERCDRRGAGRGGAHGVPRRAGGPDERHSPRRTRCQRRCSGDADGDVPRGVRGGRRTRRVDRAARFRARGLRAARDA